TIYDTRLNSNGTHHWDVPVLLHIVTSSFKSLSPGCLLVIHDTHLNANKTGPLNVAEYSALLMHSTEGRCYSVVEMEGNLAGIGFVDFDFRPTAASRSVISARKPTRKSLKT